MTEKATPGDDDKRGERVAHFRILETLGQGGMGVVYRAEDETLRRAVALKLLPDSSGNEERRQRFLREARSTAAIAHPNVAIIHQIGEADGRVYIAMELVEGENLRARLGRGRLDVATARELAVQIARGLSAAHAKGIVHRDLKPENVMITPEGVVKLLDFGLAKPAVDSRASGDAQAALAKTETLVTSGEGRVMGTPEYMSPEQAMGGALDLRSDVFSFGVLFYEMLSGTRPFVGPSTGAVLVALARDPAPSLRARAPEVDEATDAIVVRCLAKAPAERFASGAEVAAALSGRTMSLPSSSGETSRSQTTESRTEVAPISHTADLPRRPAIARMAAAGFAFVLLAALSGAGAWSWSSRGTAAKGAARATAEGSPAPSASSEEIGHSANGEARRAFEEAMRSFHDGTGQTVTLLQNAVKADPGFGAAYLRLWWMASLRGRDEYAGTWQFEAREHADEYHLRVVAMQGALSPRDRALFDALETPNKEGAHAKLDAYLAKHPDDDVAWVARLDEDPATRQRALAAEPSLVPLMAQEAYWLRTEWRDDEAATVLARCLELSPRATECLSQRAALQSVKGECAAAEVDARRWLDLQPDSRRARPTLAGILAAEGAAAAAVRETLGDDARSWSGDGQVIFEGLASMFEGDFRDVERAAKEAIARVPASANEYEHFRPFATLVSAYAEEGDVERGGRAAAEYLSRRVAWKEPTPWMGGFMVGAAARAGLLAVPEASRLLDAAFQALLKNGMDPATSWAATYAYATETRAEALRAVAKLDALGVAVPTKWRGASARTLFLAGRGDAARPILSRTAGACSDVLLLTRSWAESHLYLGELDEQRGETAAACGHYAKVLGLWGHAKPRSTTADEARTRSKTLACGR